MDAIVKAVLIALVTDARAALRKQLKEPYLTAALGLVSVVYRLALALLAGNSPATVTALKKAAKSLPVSCGH